MLISSRPNLGNKKLWLILLGYSVVAGLAQIRHEPWGDELQGWCTIKASDNVMDLLSHARYDGHPYLWYLINFIFAEFSHSLFTMQLICFVFNIAIAFLLLFYSVFPTGMKVLILSGYYFLFEYALF